MSIFEQVAFKAPNYSVYNLSHDNKSTYRIGEIVPAMHMDVAPGERVRCSVEQLTRFATMLAPVMHNFRLYVDSFFVPYRILGENYENAFNYAKDEKTYPLPSKQILAFYSSVRGRLLDYLNFPTFEKARDFVLKALNTPLYPGTISFVKKDPDTEEYVSTSFESNYLNWLSIPVSEDECRVLSNSHVTDTGENDCSYSAILLLDGKYDAGYVSGDPTNLAVNNVGSTNPALVGLYALEGTGAYPAFKPFFGFLLDKLRTFGVSDPYNLYVSLIKSSSDAFGEICSRYDLQPSSLVNEYINSVFEYLLFTQSSVIILPNEMDETNFVDRYLPILNSQTLLLNGLEYKTYWKVIFDWYINTNVDGDGEDLYKAFLDWYNGDSGDKPFDFSNPMVRRWESDYFTSCFPDGTVPAVPIPANPTIIDIRSTNKMQKLEERTLYAGKRPQDQNLAHFGVVSSNARFDRTEVLSRRIFDIDINAVTQTNQAEWNKVLRAPLGSYAGQGISVDLGQFLFDYTAEERGMLHVFVSVRPVSSYFQGLSKQSTKVSRFDFLTPMLADVGESIVKTHELYCDLGSSDATEVFGYNRQYAEYMFLPSETHGEFRNSLRHWTGARFIDIDRAVLDKSFIGVKPDPSKDDIDRIFALGAGDTIYQYLFFHVSAARPLSRYVNYSL